MCPPTRLSFRKLLKCVMEYVSKNILTTIIVEKYDCKVLVPLLLKVSKHLNHWCVVSPPLSAFNIDLIPCAELKHQLNKAISLVKIEFSLYQWICVMYNGMISDHHYNVEKITINIFLMLSFLLGFIWVLLMREFCYHC